LWRSSSAEGVRGYDGDLTGEKVIRLHDRDRGLKGGWVSVADVRGALGIDLEQARFACRDLHDRHIAELVGGFPIRPTTDKFTLVRLSAEGIRIAADPAALDQATGVGE
jgi:hypothetical protein